MSKACLKVVENRMSNTYSVVVTGQLLEGYNIESVRKAFSEVFKLSQVKVKQYLNGQPQVIKSNVNILTASKYKAKIEKAGAHVELRKATAESTGSELSSKINSHTVIDEIQKKSNTKAKVSAKKTISKDKIAQNLEFRKQSINAIDYGRIKQFHKMKNVELKAEPRNLFFILLAVALVLFSISDIGLNLLGIITITGTVWLPVTLSLVAAVLLISALEN